MKAQELRIGNWVDDADINSRYQVQAIDIIGAVQCESAGKQCDMLPIPLSPEILEKAGFKFTKLSGIGGQDQWAGFDLWSITIKGTTIDFRGGRDGKTLILSGYFNTQIQYLHTFQNVMHALTGEELTIKL